MHVIVNANPNLPLSVCSYDEFHVHCSRSGRLVHYRLPFICLPHRFSTKECLCSTRTPPQRGPSGGNAIQVHACGSGGCIGDSSHLKKVTSTEYSIAGSAYRSVVAGINSMGQTYGLDELDTARTTSTFATVQDMIRDYDFGNQNGHVLVHTETVEYRDAEDSMDMETGFGVAK